MKTFNSKKDTLMHLCVNKTNYLLSKINNLQRKNNRKYNVHFFKEKEILELDYRQLKEYFIRLTILNYLLNDRYSLKKFEKGEPYEL